MEKARKPLGVLHIKNYPHDPPSLYPPPIKVSRDTLLDWYYCIVNHLCYCEMTQRQLKFRAWDDKNKKWLCGYEYPSLGGFSLTGETVLFGEWGREFDEFIFSRNGKTPDDLKIMQFTGLRDKNGKEIYEGDIVRYGIPEREIKEVISWDNLTYQLCMAAAFDPDGQCAPMIKGKFNACEVIGNIHENPELIK